MKKTVFILVLSIVIVFGPHHGPREGSIPLKLECCVPILPAQKANVPLLIQGKFQLPFCRLVVQGFDGAAILFDVLDKLHVSGNVELNIGIIFWVRFPVGGLPQEIIPGKKAESGPGKKSS